MLGSAAAALCNAVSTSNWELHSGEWSAFKSELASAGISAGPLTLLSGLLAGPLREYRGVSVLRFEPCYLFEVWFN